MSIEIIETNFNDEAILLAKKQLADTGIFLLGEVHGVRENPSIYYTLMKKLGCKGLALEWEETSMPIVQSFLETGELTLNEFFKTSIDGRVTAGHFDLLRRLKEEDMLENLVLFDPIIDSSLYNSGKFAEERDKGMAEILLAKLNKNIPSLIVAGDIHTKIIETNGDGQSIARLPMGARIKARFPSIKTGNIKYQSGSFFNMKEKYFENAAKVDDKASFTLDPRDNFLFTLPKAHTAAVPGLSN